MTIRPPIIDRRWWSSILRRLPNRDRVAMQLDRAIHHPTTGNPVDHLDAPARVTSNLEQRKSRT